MGSLALSLGHPNSSRHAVGGSGVPVGSHCRVCASSCVLRQPEGHAETPEPSSLFWFSRAEQGGFDPTHRTPVPVGAVPR